MCPKRSKKKKDPAKVADKQISAAKPADPPKRKPGRPTGLFLENVPWVAIEKAYIYGDPLKGSENDPCMVSRRHYPSLRELGSRYNVSHALIGRKSSSLNWIKRRKTFMNALDEETDRAVAKSAALTTADAVGLIDTWFGKFESNLREDRVRADSVHDLNTVMRLREFLLGNADTRTETNTKLSLESMQARFSDQKQARLNAGDDYSELSLAGVIEGSGSANIIDAPPPPKMDNSKEIQAAAKKTVERESTGSDGARNKILAKIAKRTDDGWMKTQGQMIKKKKSKEKKKDF